MNRRFELVKKATDAAEAADGHLSPRYRYQRAAEAVVDALLPQVTTVEELEALLDGAVVVYGGHRVYRWRSLLSLLHNINDGYDYDPEDVLWPLTVVWQP